MYPIREARTRHFNRGSVVETLEGNPEILTARAATIPRGRETKGKLNWGYQKLGAPSPHGLVAQSLRRFATYLLLLLLRDAMKISLEVLKVVENELTDTIRSTLVGLANKD